MDSFLNEGGWIESSYDSNWSISIDCIVIGGFDYIVMGLIIWLEILLVFVDQNIFLVLNIL